MEVPRLTGFLRRFGKVSAKQDKLIDDDQRDAERFKARIKESDHKERGTKIWNAFVAVVKPSKEAEKEAKELRKEVREMVGGKEANAPQHLVDDVAGSVCNVLLAPAEDEGFSHALHAKVKSVTGPVTYAQAEHLFKCVHALRKSLDEDAVDKAKKVLDGREDEGRAVHKRSFGHNIEFRVPAHEPLDANAPEFSGLCDLNASDDGFQIKNELTFDLEARNLQLAVASAKSAAVAGGHPRRDPQWFEEKLASFYGDEQPAGMSLPEFALTLIQLLQSKRSSDDLQAELFDLVGFERFELIQLLLGHREELIKEYAVNKNIMKQEILSAAANAAGQELLPQRPQFGCQVLVQSEEERMLRKQVRKEEKKIHKILGKVEAEDEADDFRFDPVDLRTKRQAALANAMSQPILKEKAEATARHYQQQEVYPFVFDGMAKSKTAAGFVQGMKIALPIGFERHDQKNFEEVMIPASENAPVEIGRNLIPIDSLDEIGQAAFNGMKSLNRIQSVVCDAAYRTNENLLVCAPTGAGKTNVAMLCIVQTIKQNILNGVIKKDQFKIVYVAPMKALASEMTASFGKRLAPLGIKVKELTGDMKLTKTEIQATQMLVTTPEKWDVVTRKPGDVSLAQLVRLLIIDEVHLLHGDRGPVVESLVARTLRLVESSQTVIRIVGLSATLPNYIDVAGFLRVNPYRGLFFFDARFRPVPLAQTFIGVKETRPMAQRNQMDEVCYEKVVKFLRMGKQIMVFVHARNATAKTGMILKEMAQNKGTAAIFEPEEGPQLGLAKSAVQKSRNRQLQELFNSGIGMHHAGMLRSDRNLVEKLFAQGHIKVLCCTATLAWGVNLPAHAVIIKGTEIYDAKRGSFVDIGILDVLQIFGRAGRPQFDKSGHGTIITSHDKLSHYLSLLTNQFPIESNFIHFLADNLNAEISLGTVTNLDEAVTWLSYTYLHVRMRKNPLVYGISYAEVRDDPALLGKRREIVIDAARKLDKNKMIRFDERTGYLHACDLGRTASQFYIKHDTIEVFNEMMKPVMKEDEILDMLSRAQEFEQLKVRDDELDELDDMTHDNCEVRVSGGAENVHGKVNILLQTHISRGRVNSFSLISDQHYVVQNATRIARALFEIVLRKNWPLLAGRILKFTKTIERQMWDFETPLKQHPNVKYEILDRLEKRNFTLDKLREMDSTDIGHMINHVRAGADVKKAAMEIPLVELEATIQPITRTVLRVRLTVTANFRWNDRVHGGTEPFWIWVEDPENNHIYHHEYFLLSKKQVNNHEKQEIVFTIPIFEPLPSQYYIRAISDRWIGSETYCAISFQHLILPERHPPHTDLLDLQPLPISALNNSSFEALYNFSHFNPIQTQIFHTLYHTDKNFLLGAPTGSGKTIAAEIAMFKVFRDYPDAKVVYIAPMKALVRERMGDWKNRFERQLGKKCVELTGDVTPDQNAIKNSSVIVTTPEKWDGISRSWQTRNYVQSVALIIIDEIHLLGEDRGPVLEVIVSRTNFISSHTTRSLRIIGLSTALANARDLADWLGIDSVGLYNFRPSVRPVPLEVHIAGFPGKHYCPRMATMNKPSYQAIEQHSPTKPSLIFVASRRQTRLTALDLIAFLAGSENPKKWLHMDEGEMEALANGVKDQNLKLTLPFGIGMHHAGLAERDRKTVEELYVNQKIQVLIATATVAWGVNFPAHLVVIKGTEFFDGKQKRYVDMPITDVLQMMGRAGRPQYDDHGVACVFVHDVKKHFYKKFLYEPFPVESSLHNVLPNHLNAEIVAGTIQSKQDAMDYITWTYFFRRLVRNPTYYGLDGVDETNVNKYLSDTVDQSLNILAESCCIDFEEDGKRVLATTLGRIASYYYLSHETVEHFEQSLSGTMTAEQLLKILTDCKEFAEMPVRHNEDLQNTELAKQCPIKLNAYAMDSPHQKVHLLLQSHFCRNQLPNSDYGTDTRSVMDQAIRILQAMIDVVADAGWLSTTLRVQILLQMIIQGCWGHESSLMQLPHIDSFGVKAFRKARIDSLPGLIHSTGGYDKLAKILRGELAEDQIEDVFQSIDKYPVVGVTLSLKTLTGSNTELKGKKGSEAVREQRWIEVAMDTEYTLTVNMKRVNHNKEGRAFSPRFTKSKDEGWFLVLGSVEDNELLGLKRASVYKGRASTQHQVTFFTPEKAGRVVYTLYIMSDAYLGLDQQYDICLDVVEGYEEPADELDDDQARFALLAMERERMEKKRSAQQQKQQQAPPQAGDSSDYASLGARPKGRR